MSKLQFLTETEYMEPQWTRMLDASKIHVFSTYRAYARHRDDSGAWDIGQRNLALYKRLRSRPREAWVVGQCPFGHVTVDEVQDITAVELALVLSACGNQPQNLSLFGDTTQQVTPGLVVCFVDMSRGLHCFCGFIGTRVGQLFNWILLSNAGSLFALKKFEK